MDQSDMGNTAMATIAPSNCKLKPVNASKLNRALEKGKPECELGGVKNGANSNKLHIHRRKSNLYQSPRSTSSNQNNTCENDSTSSPLSESKKPLHLQIVDDVTCTSSSSGNENENETSYSTENENSTQGSCGNHNVRSSPNNLTLKSTDGAQSVPVSSERDEIMHTETSLNDGIIIRPSPRLLNGDNKSVYRPIVAIGDDLNRECGIPHTSNKDIKVQTKGTLKNNVNVDHLSLAKRDLTSSTNMKKINRENQRESSTPDLASTCPCTTDSIETSLNESAKNVIRAVSTSCSEFNSEVEDDKVTASERKLPVSDPSNEQLSSSCTNVASALDQVLAELEEKGVKKKMAKPCILQQSLAGDSGSSTGTSTPSEDFLDGAKKDIGGSCNSISGVGDDDKANSLQVQSSMLLPEDSLNVIAQMTVSSEAKKEKKNVVTFKDDCYNNINTSANKATPCKDSNENKKRQPLSEAIKMEIVHPIIPSPPNDKFTPQEVDEVPKETTKRPPLISGTASAQLKLIAGKSSNTSNRNSDSISLSHIDSETSDHGKGEKKENGIVWEKGMSMLADIISNATPMKTKTRKQSYSAMDSEISSNSNIAPVGQSLRLYTTIAAQAGISSYTPANVTTVNNSPVKNHAPPKSQPCAPEKQINECCPNHNSVAEPPSVPQHYIREIGKIRRYDASIGRFSEWENLPFQTYGDSEPRRWCELNIDESIEIPLRRGGRLRVFPNFLGETRRMSTKFAMDNCRHYRQYNVVGENQTSLEPRLQVLLSSQAPEEENSSGTGVGYSYHGVTMKAKPLSCEPQIEKLHNDLAELYRLPNKQWSIGANLLYYRDNQDHTSWHADDSQGEALILCIVVDSESNTRPILVKPKTDIGFRDGDEEIIIFVGQGDAYEMDGKFAYLHMGMTRIRLLTHKFPQGKCN